MLRLFDFWESDNAYKVRVSAQPRYIAITDQVGTLVESP